MTVSRRGYCQLKEEALDRAMWRNRFGRGFGPVVWQITDDDDDDEVLGLSQVCMLMFHTSFNPSPSKNRSFHKLKTFNTATNTPMLPSAYCFTAAQGKTKDPELKCGKHSLNLSSSSFLYECHFNLLVSLAYIYTLINYPRQHKIVSLLLDWTTSFDRLIGHPQVLLYCEDPKTCALLSGNFTI